MVQLVLLRFSAIPAGANTAIRRGILKLLIVIRSYVAGRFSGFAS
jgi:hypothetical protein